MNIKSNAKRSHKRLAEIFLGKDPFETSVFSFFMLIGTMVVITFIWFLGEQTKLYSFVMLGTMISISTALIVIMGAIAIGNRSELSDKNWSVFKYSGVYNVIILAIASYFYVQIDHTIYEKVTSFEFSRTSDSSCPYSIRMESENLSYRYCDYESENYMLLYQTENKNVKLIGYTLREKAAGMEIIE